MKIRNIILVTCSLLMLTRCTDVDEMVYDKYSADGFYASPVGPDVALAKAYSQISGNWDGVGYAGADNGWYDMNAMSSDEQVIPHRVDGNWQPDFARLHLHKFLPSDVIINNTWKWLYKSVFEANLAIYYLEQSKSDESKIAEAKVLRAFFYYLLIDSFGDVPFFTDNNTTVDLIPQKSRKDVYEFVLSELVDNVDKLPVARGGDFYGRFNKWAGYTLLAKVYLNSEVYAGTVKWQECLDACIKIDEGGFTLHPGGTNASSPLGFKYFELFGDVLPEDETILAMYAHATFVSRNIYGIRSLHGPNAKALIGYDGWNGTIVPSNYYDMFSNDDIRKNQFIIGAQPGGVTYVPTVSSLDDPGAGVEEGVRNLKFFPVGTMDGGGASNDFPIYRYADILLMKAECLVRLNKAADAIPFVDAVRQRAGLDGLVAAPTLDDIYLERSLELNWEGHRRQDMIRFEKFLLPNQFRGASPDFRKLFPIPTAALNANPSLKQNLGYN